MIREPFVNGTSPLHRLDPRLRILTAVLFSFVVALAERFPALWTGLALGLFLTVLARLNPREVFRRLAVVWGFLLLLWLVLPFTIEGGPVLYRLGPLAATREGLLLAARITLKSNAILLGLMALIATMPLTTLGHALDRLRVPPKMVHLLLLTYRYIFVLEQEYQRLSRAARLRNFRPGTNLHTYRTYAYLVGMLFVRASARADRVYRAMRCRGFQGKFYCLQEFSIRRRDWVWSGFLTAGIAATAVLEWGGLWL